MVYGDGMSSHTVGDVARMAGISVRTLHHYDKIGLLSPQERTDAGYRVYGQSDVEQLQHILFYRELGLPLDEIQKAMSDAGFDRASALRRQRDLMVAKVGHLEHMIDAIDTALTSNERKIAMNAEETLEVFGDFDPTEHEDEARERWGHTDAYKESARRTATYTRDDWERIGAESQQINDAFLRLMATGVPSDSGEAMSIAERHRAHISNWFYECSAEIHVGLGEVYVQDQRFTENIDKAGGGLARYMSDAILANGVQLLD
jgi:MerR family transcriptional regulator, thiopeptide resistance regulator